jgi:hypothetical protein
MAYLTTIRVLLIALRIGLTELIENYPLSLSTSSIARRTCVGPGEAKILPHTAAYRMKSEKVVPKRGSELPDNMPRPSRSCEQGRIIGSH